MNYEEMIENIKVNDMLSFKEYDDYIRTIYSFKSDQMILAAYHFYLKYKNKYNRKTELNFYKLCIYIVDNYSSNKEIKKILYCLIDYHYKYKEYDYCIEIYFKAKEIEGIEVNLMVAFLSYISSIMVNINERNKALNYAIEAIHLKDFDSLDRIQKIILYSNLSNIYASLYMFNEANKYKKLAKNCIDDSLSKENRLVCEYYQFFLENYISYTQAYLNNDGDEEIKVIKNYCAYFIDNNVFIDFDNNDEMIRSVIRHSFYDDAEKICLGFINSKDISIDNKIKFYRLLLMVLKKKNNVLLYKKYQYEYINLLENSIDDIRYNQKVYIINQHELNNISYRMEKISQSYDVDLLTGAYTKNKFLDSEDEYASFIGNLIFFDLDRLKVINDTYGHKKGDLLLIDFVNIIKEVFQEQDKLFRVGGDEFILITFENNKDKLKILLELMNDKCRIKDICFSAGISELTGNNNIMQEVVYKADKSMYYAKKKQKKVYAFYDDILY